MPRLVINTYGIVTLFTSINGGVNVPNPHEGPKAKSGKGGGLEVTPVKNVAQGSSPSRITALYFFPPSLSQKGLEGAAYKTWKKSNQWTRYQERNQIIREDWKWDK